MSLLLELRSKYEPNEPIFLEDIKSEKYSYDTVKSMLSTYVKDDKLRRYVNGVYYFPKKGVIGEATIVFDDYLQKKYIRNNKETFGYYTGLTLINILGLSTQVPNIREISTNIETNKKRKISIHSRDVILRRPLIKITQSNYMYLQLLDIFRFADIDMIRTNKDKIIQFIHQNQLKKSVLYNIALSYPIKARLILLEEGFFSELT